jgi:hypothetical protein
MHNAFTYIASIRIYMVNKYRCLYRQGIWQDKVNTSYRHSVQPQEGEYVTKICTRDSAFNQLVCGSQKAERAEADEM